MRLFSSKIECCGCRVCADICPKGCISFEKDDETFYYPVIDEHSCLHCGLCTKVCPINNVLYSEEAQDFYVGIHKQRSIVQESSSGGAFSAIAEQCLKQGYFIVGTALTSQLEAIVSIAQNETELNELKKSKYLLSNAAGCYNQVCQLLLEGKMILFSGTPCQVAAMKNYVQLKRLDSNHIIYVDLLCHGAPSQDIFNSYIQELERQKGKRVDVFQFRNKKPINGHINSRSVRIVFNDGEELLLDKKRCSFLLGYHSRLFYRPSCYSCQFAKMRRCGDITLADAWGANEINPNLNPIHGVSLLLINSDRGRHLLLDRIRNQMNLYQVSSAWAYESNDTLRKATVPHPKRDLFFQKYRTDGFSKAVQKSVRISLIKRGIMKLYRLFFPQI